MLRLSSLQPQIHPPFPSPSARYLAQCLDRLIYLHFYILIISSILCFACNCPGWGGGEKRLTFFFIFFFSPREVEFSLKTGFCRGPLVSVAFAWSKLEWGESSRFPGRKVGVFNLPSVAASPGGLEAFKARGRLFPNPPTPHPGPLTSRVTCVMSWPVHGPPCLVPRVPPDRPKIRCLPCPKDAFNNTASPFHVRTC